MFIGILTPVLIIAGCIGFLLVFKIVLGPWEWGALTSAMRLGLVFGVFISLAGLVDITLGRLFLKGGRSTNRVYRAAGFMPIWSAVVGAIIY